MYTHLATRWVTLICFFTVCIYVLVSLVDRMDNKLFSRSQPKTPAATTAAANTTSATSTTPAPVVTPKEQKWEAIKLLTEASVAQDDALSHLERWETEIEPMQRGASGEEVAKNDELVKKLAFVVNKPRMTKSELKVAGERIKLLRKSVEAIPLDDDTKTISTSEVFEIRELHGKITVAERAWNRAVDQANAIIVKANVPAKEPDESPDLETKLAEVQADTKLNELDQEIAHGHVDDTPESVGANIDPSLREAALSQEVQSTLAPFLEPRRIQPSLAGSFSIKFTRTNDKQPMSLSKLKSIGALDDSVLGRKKLALIGGNRKLPEPKWSIASQPNGWNEGDEDFLIEAQRMLREYGAALVAEGRLSL